MSNLKCPFCNKPLQPTLRQSDEYWCENYDCSGTNIEWVGSQKLWQELTKLMENKDLSDKIGKLETELDRTRKELDVAVDALKRIADAPIGYCMFAERALEQITALEQKEVK